MCGLQVEGDSALRPHTCAHWPHIGFVLQVHTCKTYGLVGHGRGWQGERVGAGGSPRLVVNAPPLRPPCCLLAPPTAVKRREIRWSCTPCALLVHGAAGRVGNLQVPGTSLTGLALPPTPPLVSHTSVTH